MQIEWELFAKRRFTFSMWTRILMAMCPRTKNNRERYDVGRMSGQNKNKKTMMRDLKGVGGDGGYYHCFDDGPIRFNWRSDSVPSCIS